MTYDVRVKKASTLKYLLIVRSFEYNRIDKVINASNDHANADTSMDVTLSSNQIATIKNKIPNNLFISGNVHLTNADGFKFRT